MENWLRSNDTFKGENVSIRKHGEEYLLIDSKTGKPLGIGSLESVQAEFDKRNRIGVDKE